MKDDEEIVNGLYQEVIDARGPTLDELGIRMHCRRRLEGESDAAYRCDVLMRRLLYTDDSVLVRYAR